MLMGRPCLRDVVRFGDWVGFENRCCCLLLLAHMWNFGCFCSVGNCMCQGDVAALLY